MNELDAKSISELWSLSKPEGRFNDWGERKWIQASEEKQMSVNRELAKLEIGQRERDLFRAARLTDSKGVEFVLVSNAQLPAPVGFEGGGLIVPCFYPLNPLDPKTERRQAAMMKRGQFIYDGWVSNDGWTATQLERIVALLDDVVSLFSLVGNYTAYWEPKYNYSKGAVPSHLFSPHDLQALGRTINLMNQIPQTDREALSRSVVWLSNALRNAPIQRFLLLFVSIESLATYIESSKTPKDSILGKILAADRPSRLERRRQRDACIQTAFAENPPSAHTVQKAYHECISQSIRKMLESHLDRVFGNDQVSKMIFEEKVSGKTLWLLRNDIAHGNLNVLDQGATRFLTSRVGVLEKIARDYLRIVFATLAQGGYFPKTRRPVLTIPTSQAIGSPSTQYEGPTDMAEYYANIEPLSSSFVRVSPQG